MIASPKLGRRSAMALMGGATVAAATGMKTATAVAAPRRGKPLDIASQAGRLRTYMLMRGALDDRLVIGCASGQYFGVVGEELTPLFGVVSATFSRYRPSSAGGYEAVAVEFAYFTDPKTGDAIGPFRNPYTGEMLEVPGGGFMPVKFSFTPDLHLKMGTDIPGMVFDHRVGAPEVRGDDVWITELTRTLRTEPGRAKPFRYSEVVTMHARRSELEVPGVKRVICETNFSNVVAWRPWLNMGDRPGHMMSVGSGRYGATPETLPAAWIAATRVQHPELLADPLAILAPMWNA